VIQEIVQVDAFTGEAYAGNPAAVCIMKGPADEAWMQQVAREMNLSETAFLYPIEGGYHLRWLTPRAEVDLCGHATLATAHFLVQEGIESGKKPIRFKTRSGWVSALRNGSWIELDFPANPPKEADPPSELLDALGVTPEYFGLYPKAYFVQVGDDTIVRKLRPDMTALEKLPETKVSVTAIDSTGKADFISRLFAPALGIPEDPVNGNSHTALTPYWAGKLGKKELLAHQASERGGVLKLRLRGNRVTIAGQAVTVMRGKLLY
jgi:PhzF family phenazine biosynthesis protein